MTGMIFQFNSEQGTGLIMFSDGEQKEFSTDEWVDESNMPSVGLKILYEDSDDLIKIKVLSEEDIKKISSAKKPKEEELTNFSSLEEFQTYFSDKGFDIIKNTDEPTDKQLTMGRLSDEGVQSVSISFVNSKSELTKNIISLSSVDDYIQYFKDTGYRLIKDSEDNASRNATLRRYVMDKHSEISIEANNDKITLTKMLNGKEVS